MLSLVLGNCRARYAELVAYLDERQLAGLQEVAHVAAVHVPTVGQMRERVAVLEDVGYFVTRGTFHRGHESFLLGPDRVEQGTHLGGAQRLYQTHRLGGKVLGRDGGKRRGTRRPCLVSVIGWRG